VILPPPDPKAAVIGGLIVARPKDDLIFAWDVGQPLSRLRALTKTEGKKAIERASFGLFEPPPQGPLTVVPDPMPMTPPEPQSTREVLPAPRSGLLPIE
jgi:hypothetical protein